MTNNSPVLSAEVLVEIPETATNVLPLGPSAAKSLGLHNPTLLQLVGGVALINGETGTLYRKFPLPKSRVTVVSAAYVIAERAFVLALSDRTVVTVPETAKDAAEYKQELWPAQPIAIVAPTPASEVYILCEGGLLAHVALKEGRAVSPTNAKTSFVDGDLSDNSQFLVASPSYVAVSYIASATATDAPKKKAKKTVSTEQEIKVSLFPRVDAITGSSTWLTSPTVTSALSGQSISSMVAHGENGFSVMTSSNEGTAWNKFDNAGTRLFVADIDMEKGESIVGSWYVVGSLWVWTTNQRLLALDIRFGSITRQFSFVRQLATGSAAVIGLGPDDSTLALIVAQAGETGPTTVHRREFASRSDVSPVSTLSKLGALKSSTTNAKITWAQIISKHGAELKELHAKYVKHVLGEGVTNDKKIKFTVNDVLAKTVLSAAENDVASLDENGWELLKPFIRAGAVSLNRSPSLLQGAMNVGRVDVISEIVRFVVDVREVQVLTIIRWLLRLPNSIVSRISAVASTLLFDTSIPSIPASVVKKLTTLTLLRAFLETVILRPSAFSKPLLSEASSATLDIPSVTIVMRVLSLIVKELLTTSSSSNNSQILSNVGDEQMRHASTWLEALIDAHFTELALAAPTSEYVRRALHSVITAVGGGSTTNATVALNRTEETLGLWSQLDRFLTRQGDVLKNQLGVYQVETLTF